MLAGFEFGWWIGLGNFPQLFVTAEFFFNVYGLLL